MSHRVSRPAGAETVGESAALRRSALGLAGLLALGCGLLQPVAGLGQLVPENPAIAPDIVSTLGGRPVHGHVSARRSTHDGRVRVKGSSAAPRWFYTARAELFERSIVDVRRTSDGNRVGVDPARFHASVAPGAQPGHIEICDPYLATGGPKNPYVCATGGSRADCYDVTVILAVNIPAAGSKAARVELWSTPVTITVRNPKSPGANVTRVELGGPPVRAPFDRPPRRAGEVLLEPVTSGDGRLLIANSGDTLLYSVMAESATPCDARGWKRLEHLSRAHRDSRMQRYGIARYPIRDTENRPIRAGRPVKGAYPWIDRQAKNLFFTQAGSDGLFFENAAGKTRSRFEVLNPPPRREIELGGATRFGMSWLGLWSQGKIVIPDTRVNNIDFHTGRRGYRPRIVLYDGSVDGVELERAPIVDLNSPENQWNYRAAFLPRAPRDVVWWLSANNGMTSEVVFDDALDNGVLIYSPMNAAIHNKKRAWRDGFDAKRGGYLKTPRIQNAAASELRWAIPAFGVLTAARVEPIAAGGVTAKGLWLDGDAGRLEYTVPEQPSAAAMDGEVWTTTLWLDARESGTRRRLLTFPDGSWVDLQSDRVVLGGIGAERAIDLTPAPEPRRWSHLAFASSSDRVDLYLDGMKLASVQGSYLRPRAGLLTLGRPGSSAGTGFRGWVDELRVVSGVRGPEAMCNYADGTLRGLDRLVSPAEFEVAASYPAATHDEISALLAASSRPTWERYRCERERDPGHPCLDSRVRLSGGEASCVGRALLFPEGPLYHDLPRPESRGNPVCRSCHAPSHPTATLGIARPLRAGRPDTGLHQDPRRQPSQAPVRIHGFLPRALLGMATDTEAPLDGLLLDRWVYSGSPGGGEVRED